MSAMDATDTCPGPAYRTLFESAPGRFLVLDPGLTIVAASNDYLHAVGAVRGDLMGRRLFDALLEDPSTPGAEGARELAGSLERVFRDRVADAPPVLQYDLRSRGPSHGAAKAGSLWSQLNTPVFTGSGEIAYVIHRIEDATGPARVRDEANRAWAGGAPLCNADHRKDEFLAMLAHELRNPLASINNAVTLLRRQADGSACPKFLELIGREVGHLAHLVDDLLDVSRITQGKIRLRPEWLRLEDVVARAVESTRHLVDVRGHGLSIALEPQPLWLDADPLRLEQILTNLLTNAAKYTEPGGRIGLTARVESDTAVIRVIDTGVGIPCEMLPRIFDLFAQADSSLDRSLGGLGVGLTLVRSLTELHGGTVTAHSAGPGRGSEFVVRFPAPRAAAAGEHLPAVCNTPGHTPRQRRILLVDDNIESAECLALILGLSGHEVQVVHDGPAALEAAAHFRPEVFLLDLGLPGLDGYQVAHHLRDREREEARQTVLVALTGYGHDDDRRRTREAGFDHHLLKPVDPDDLLRLLERDLRPPP